MATEPRRCRNAISVSALLLLCSGFAGGSLAHHSFISEFDPETQATLRGEVVAARFVNPHVRYRLRVLTDGGSSEEWVIQTHNVGIMRRLEWTPETIAVGDRIEVSGALGRGGARKISMESVVLADGTRRNPRGGEVADAYTETEVAADPNKFYGVTANRYPIDITGFWTNRYGFRLTVDDLEPKPTPFTPEGRRVFEATEPWHDARKRCSASGLPRTFGTPTVMEIVDAGTHYLMLIGAEARRIWMDGRGPPAAALPSPLGFSRGRWDGHVLVIETTHLRPGWLDGTGLPMSGDGTRLVERYTPSDDRLTMDRVMTIHDPYYTEPLIRRRGSARSDALEVSDGGNDCDALGHFRDLWDQGLLEALWGLTE